tara:strand:- start:179 stop:373 length:195 start_codon:yes stop_codon:yes gene_type:complete
MKIPFKLFACILSGMFLIGCSLGFILGFYIHEQTKAFIWMYLSAPCFGLGSGLIIYGTLYGRNK